MSETIAIRVSDRALEALRRGETVRVRLDASNVVGGVVRKAGRRPGRNPQDSFWWQTGALPQPGSLPANLLLWTIEHGGSVDSRQARRFLR